jgi:ABC-type sugar transport system ATPase subunit
MYGTSKHALPVEPPLLSLTLASRQKGLEPFSLTLHAGEILGLGGLKGSGGDTILGMLNGDIHTNAKMILDGESYRPLNPSAAWRRGIATLPGDRTGEGLIVDFSVETNLSLARIPQRMAVIDRKAEKQMVNEVIDLLHIKTETPQAVCSSLSGGNLQKVVLGKCIGAKPRILLLNNPTRGIDVGARAQIYDAIRKLVADGMGVILLSEDLPELIGLSDRIIVMRKGHVSHTFQRGEAFSEEAVIEYMI